MNLKGKSFLKLLDLTNEEMAGLLDLAADLKAKKKAGIPHKLHEGKNIVLLFEKDSTRTRCAFEVAGHDLGMGVTYLGPTGSQMGKKESIADTARVLGRMYDGIEYRGFAHVHQLLALQIAQVLTNGEEVGQDLGGVEFIGQAIPNGNTGVSGQVFHDGLGETTVLNAVVHTAQDSGGVGDGFLLAHLAAAGS